MSTRKKEEEKEHMLMRPNMKLVNIANPVYLQTLNLNKLKVISQKLCQLGLAYTTMVEQILNTKIDTPTKIEIFSLGSHTQRAHEEVA
jgi:hypothetical protein